MLTLPPVQTLQLYLTRETVTIRLRTQHEPLSGQAQHLRLCAGGEGGARKRGRRARVAGGAGDARGLLAPPHLRLPKEPALRPAPARASAHHRQPCRDAPQPPSLGRGLTRRPSLGPRRLLGARTGPAPGAGVTPSRAPRLPCNMHPRTFSSWRTFTATRRRGPPSYSTRNRAQQQEQRVHSR